MTGKVWKYINEKIESEGALHFSLIDPDPLSITPEQDGLWLIAGNYVGSFWVQMVSVIEVY